MNEDQILTTPQLAEYLQMHPKTISQLANKGKIPARKVGNSWRFSKLAIDKWMQQEYYYDKSQNSDR